MIEFERTKEQLHSELRNTTFSDRIDLSEMQYLQDLVARCTMLLR